MSFITSGEDIINRMRKKILAFAIVLIFVFSFITGCGLIETNFDRDMQRTVAYVGDADVYQEEIKKFELVSYFMSQASSYLQSGKTIEETVDEILNQMVYRRIVVQEVTSFLLNDFYADPNKSALRSYLTAKGFTYYRIKGYSDGYDKSKIDTDDEWEIFDFEKVTVNIKSGMILKDILDPKDITVRVVGVEGIEPYDRVVDAKSSDMLAFLLRVYYDKGYPDIAAQTVSFKEYYKALKESKLFSDYLVIQAYNNVWASEKSALDSLEAQIRKDLDVEPKKDETPAPKTTRAVPKKDALERTFTRPNPNEESVNDLKKESDLANDKLRYRREAFKKYESQIQKNQFGLTYDQFFEKQLKQEMEQRLLEVYEIIVIQNQVIEYGYFQERFNRILKSEQQQFHLSLSDYKTKLESVGDSSFVLYNLDAGVIGYVQHILLGIDTEDNKLINKHLSELKRKELDRASYLNARTDILNGIKVKDLRENMEHRKPDEGRFPGYPEFLGVNDDSEDYLFGIEDFYKNRFKSYFEGNLIAGTDISGIYKTEIEQEDLFKKFQQYIYMYNTDDGMFRTQTGYLLMEKNTLNAESSQYVSEFAKGSRDVIQKTYTARDGGDDVSYFYTMVATDFGWHIILCTDVIFPGSVVLDFPAFDAIQTAIKADTVTFADLSNPIYKLYKIIQKEHGGQNYNDSLNSFVNDFYNYNNGSKVILRKDRISDLYDL